MQIRVKAKPNSKKEGISKLGENYFEVKVSAPPVKGLANKRITELLAKYFNVPKSRVKLIKGATGREKVFEIELPEEK
ncbi:MAG: DUF167 domain-containing protein [Aquificae bacterium]|jgi:uncharacterized protein (TIGR00251 family)|nr:DUF167 domain-containing protein [Aquificota bacterium]